jgi:hypothetical protein
MTCCVRFREMPGARRVRTSSTLELARKDPAQTYPGTAIHLASCPGCAADHAGLLDAARRFGDLTVE